MINKYFGISMILRGAMDLLVEWGADFPVGTYMKVILLGSKVK